jgi:hypothetical protein
VADFPPAPPEEESRDACCGRCSSLFHSTSDHPDRPNGALTSARIGTDDDFPPGYDPGDADRLIGRDVRAAQ